MTTPAYAPEILLELARECMPKPTDIYKDDDPPTASDHVFDGEWRIEGGRVLRVWYDLAVEAQCDVFDTIGNDAHWAAVERWLFGQPVRVFKNNIGRRGGYVIEWTGSDGGVIGASHYDTNLAAAVAVLERKKEKGE